MSRNETFKAIIQVHELNDVLLENSFDEENAEEENIILQIVKIIKGSYDYKEEENQIYVAYEFLEGILSEPFDENKKYEALISNEYMTERDIYTLQIYELKAI